MWWHNIQFNRKFPFILLLTDTHPSSKASLQLSLSLTNIDVLSSISYEYTFNIESNKKYYSSTFTFLYEWIIDRLNSYRRDLIFTLKCDIKYKVMAIVGVFTYQHYLLAHLILIAYYEGVWRILVLILMMQDQLIRFLHLYFPIIDIYLLRLLLFDFDLDTLK